MRQIRKNCVIIGIGTPLFGSFFNHGVKLGGGVGRRWWRGAGGVGGGGWGGEAFTLNGKCSYDIALRNTVTKQALTWVRIISAESCQENVVLVIVVVAAGMVPRGARANWHHGGLSRGTGSEM